MKLFILDIKSRSISVSRNRATAFILSMLLVFSILPLDLIIKVNASGEMILQSGAPDLTGEGLIRADLSGALAGSSSNYGTNLSAAAAVDGNLDTMWVADGPELPQTLAVDLGKTKDIAQIKTTFEAVSNYEYQLFYSLDGKRWRYYGAQPEGSPAQQVFINTGAVTARYVAIIVTGTGINPQYDSPYWVGIREFEALSANELTRKTVSVNDPAVKYLGRYELINDGTEARLYFESGMSIGFTGTSVGVNITGGSGFFFSVDNGRFEEVPRGAGRYTLAENLPSGNHTLRIYNYWENARCTIGGIVLDGDGVLISSPERPTIEFIGDSITAGTHNKGAGLKHSYSWMTGELLGFDFNVIAKPGIRLLQPAGGDELNGMMERYFRTREYRAGEESPLWDTSLYCPDYIVINLTTNDLAAADTVKSKYAEYLEMLRNAYPETTIFAVSPFGGKYHDAVQAAVDDINNAGDSKVIFIDTSGWLSAGDFYDGVHPSDAGARKAALLLSDAIAGHIGLTTLSEPVDLTVSLGSKVYDKCVVASSMTDSASSAAAALDNNSETKWTPNGATMPQWLTVDLGDIYDIGAIYVELEKWADWHITAEVSSDGESWTEFASEEKHMWETTIRGTATGRYLRLKAENTNGAWTGVYSFDVYTTEKVSPILSTEPPEATITRVLRFGTADIDESYLKTIRSTATEYVDGIFRRLREHGYDSKLMRLYVVGGGGCLIRNFGSFDENRVTINDDICATAKGYERMLEMKLIRSGGKA